ncbi:MAG: Uma2 family endonuclease [Labilithrix sp.]|nr:Uma2 family endonuclease [Labilithrix sp.]MCW5814452.1 Uma2 family endonuclease [Labilithrix sp.]
MTTHSEDMTTLSYSVPRVRAGWELPEEQMPQSELHVEVIDLLSAILRYWAARSGARIVRDLAVRWIEERPNVGVDPDLAVLVPSPPDEMLTSLRTWQPGHAPPLLAIEVVSDANPRKDYEIAPEKYAASGTQELVVFDPLLVGPKTHGGPILLQVWRRDARDRFTRVYSGGGPVRSHALDAYLVVTNDGRRLRVAKDAAATDFWLTGEEAASAAKEVERAAKEAALSAKEAALARVAELEAELARRR